MHSRSLLFFQQKPKYNLTLDRSTTRATLQPCQNNFELEKNIHLNFKT